MVPNGLFLDQALEPQDTRTWCVLHLISRGRGFADSTDGQLAETMAVSLATVKRSLLRLERSGWIYREQVDSRRVIALIPDAHADQDLRLRVLS
jgi:transcription initiation factor IIE alpha subunit